MSVPKLLMSNEMYRLGMNTHSILSYIRGTNADEVIGAGLRIFVVGFVITALRRVYQWAYKSLLNRLFPIAYINGDDPAHDWIMSWLAQDPAAVSQLHHFQLSTVDMRLVRKKNGNALRGSSATGYAGRRFNKALRPQDSSWQSGEIIGQMLPCDGKQIRIRHNGRTLWVCRRGSDFAGSATRMRDHIRVWTIAFQRDALQGFLVAAHQLYFAKEEAELLIFHAGCNHKSDWHWESAVSRPSRPWSSVILPGDVKNNLLIDIEKFLSDKERAWYAARGIPHRRGYLFHGTPGAGKTTLGMPLTALASKLRLDVYVLNPNQHGLDDAKLGHLFGASPAPCVILIEDIDCIFSSETRGGQAEESQVAVPHKKTKGTSSAKASVLPPNKHDLPASSVSLSGLLNAIDGVSSQEGCILIASTNHPEALDPALYRPGRFDMKVEFTNATPSQVRALFLHFYPIDGFTSETEDSDIADIAHTEKTEAKASHLIKNQADLEDLAQRFTYDVFLGSSIISSENALFSMATLQGYLMGYKDDPMAAVEHAKEWAEGLQP